MSLDDIIKQNKGQFRVRGGRGGGGRGRGVRGRTRGGNFAGNSGVRPRPRSRPTPYSRVSLFIVIISFKIVNLKKIDNILYGGFVCFEC